MKIYNTKFLLKVVNSNRQILALPLIFIIFTLCNSPVQSDEKLNDPGFVFYTSWNNITLQDAPAFWSFQANKLSRSDINKFNKWHRYAKFKDISPKIGGAYFFKSPWPHEVSIDTDGNMVFKRTAEQKEAHTMIEISVDNKPDAGNFVDYGGFRSMSTGEPYEIELEVMVNNGNWIETIPWLLVFQGHTIPGIFNRGKKFNPPFALLISRGRWEVHIRADSRLSLPADRDYERFEKIDLGPVTPDNWTRFRIKVMWGDKDFPNGNGDALGLWRDNKLYHKEWGVKNYYNNRSLAGDKLGPYLMIGAYTPVFDKEHDPITIKFKEFTLRKF